MKKSSSLAVRIILSFLVLIVLSTGTVGWFASSKTDKALTDMAHQSLEQQLGAVKNEINAKMLNVENLIQIINELPPIVAYKNEVDNGELKEQTIAEAMDILKQFRESISEVAEVVFITDAEGNVVLDSADGGYDGINVKERAYFINSMEKNTYWDDVLVSKGSGQPVTVFSIPMLSAEGETLGIVAAAIKFNAVTDPLSRVKVGETGYAYMLDKKGLVLYHPQEERIMVDNLLDVSKESNNIELENIVTDMMAMNAGSGEYSFQDVHKLNLYDTVSNWSIAVNIPTSEYKETVVETRNALTMITLMAIVVAGIVAIVLSNNITKPVKVLMRLMATAEKGNLNVVADVKGNDEIAELGKSFNLMMDGLKTQADAVERLSKGDLDITLELKSEEDTLGKALETMLQTLNHMRNEIDTLIQSTNRGELGVRAESSEFEGAWCELVQGINNIVDAYAKPINITTEYVTAIGMGNIPEKITETYYGDFNQIKNSLNSCIDAMNALLSDTHTLINDAVEGKLDARADASLHEGDYKEVIIGINSILDAVVQPIKEASNVLTEFSNGNLNAEVKGHYKGGHAQIKDALNGTIQTISSYIDEIRDVLTKMAEGNMDQHIHRPYLGDFVEIKDSINLILGAFNEVLFEINQASEQVSSGAHHVSQSSESLSQGATEQASAIEQISASIGDIASKTKNAAMKAQDINSLSVRVRGDAEKGDSEMKSMLMAMGEIEESSVSISQIIKVIDEIAFQTNLLALNAAVEAARAGQHGKGFAVVAEEVRNLAARSAKAAKETTNLIEASISRVKQGTEIANQTAGDLQKIVGGIGDVVNIISEIATEANDQALAVAEVNEGVNQVSTVTQMNTATAQESAAASEEMSSQAMVLQEMVGRFNLKD